MFEFNEKIIETSKGDIIIRRAKEKDCPFIMNLYSNVYKGKYTIECCTNASAYIEAVELDEYLWIIAEFNEKIIGSVIFNINFECRIAKAVGAAIRPDFQGLNLMKIMADIGTEFCLNRTNAVDLIYSTARTANIAPQKILQDIGYKCIGILPNVVKVKNFETHAIFVKYKDDMWKNYYQYEKEVLAEVSNFYEFVRNEFELPKLKVKTLPSKKRINYSDIQFEFVYNPKRVMKIFNQRLKEKGRIDRFFLQKPNLLLYNTELECEIFIKWIDSERQANIILLNYENRKWYSILDSLCNACYNLNIRYFEFIIDANDLKKQKAAIEAKFVPSAYFPGLFISDDKRKIRSDAVIFIRSFEVLDFNNLQVSEVGRDFLIEFYFAWQDIYIGNFFKNLK